MFEEIQITPAEEGKSKNKGRELPVKNTWGYADKRAGAAQASNAS
jgi:hypothetical protein